MILNRICSVCKEDKDISLFYKSKRKDGLEPYCKQCRNSWNKKAYEKNKIEWNERIKKVRLKRIYNLTIEDLHIMKNNQNSKCLICDKDIELGLFRSGNSAVVDHCHITNKVRGLLCTVCNQGLGMFNDNISLLKRAIKYLEK